MLILKTLIHLDLKNRIFIPESIHFVLSVADIAKFIKIRLSISNGISENIPIITEIMSRNCDALSFTSTSTVADLEKMIQVRSVRTIVFDNVFLVYTPHGETNNVLYALSKL